MAPKIGSGAILESAAETLVKVLAQQPLVIGALDAWLDARRQTLLEGLLRSADSMAEVEKVRGKSDMLNEIKGVAARARPDTKGENDDG